MRDIVESFATAEYPHVANFLRSGVNVNDRNLSGAVGRQIDAAAAGAYPGIHRALLICRLTVARDVVADRRPESDAVERQRRFVCRCYASRSEQSEKKSARENRRVRTAKRWGGWIRTNAWRSQSPLPYRLATPHRQPRNLANAGRSPL